MKYILQVFFLVTVGTNLAHGKKEIQVTSKETKARWQDFPELKDFVQKPYFPTQKSFEIKAGLGEEKLFRAVFENVKKGRLYQLIVDRSDLDQIEGSEDISFRLDNKPLESGLRIAAEKDFIALNIFINVSYSAPSFEAKKLKLRLKEAVDLFNRPIEDHRIAGVDNRFAKEITFSVKPVVPIRLWGEGTEMVWSTDHIDTIHFRRHNSPIYLLFISTPRISKEIQLPKSFKNVRHRIHGNFPIDHQDRGEFLLEEGHAYLATINQERADVKGSYYCHEEEQYLLSDPRKVVFNSSTPGVILKKTELRNN